MKTTTKNTKHEDETVGRTYESTHFAIHSRRIGGDGNWYGMSRYGTHQEALNGIDRAGKPVLGGLVSISGGREEYEYRIVEVNQQCKVVHTEHRII